MTLPEVILWQHLRTRPAGLKFRKQHPIDPYVVDFFCREAALVIEVDGAAHDMGNNPERDTKRDERLRARGLHILRFAAKDVLHDIDAVLTAILVAARNPLHHPSDGSPPRPGEEQHIDLPRHGEVAARRADGRGSPPAQSSVPLETEHEAR